MTKLPNKYIKCTESLEKDAIPSSTLYHYTNFTGLKGILTTQRLWLTHYAQLTDTSEIKFAISAIREYILLLPDNQRFTPFWESLFEDIESFISNECEFYICSFCRKKDYLDAWRNYGADGLGFSLGFKKSFFNGVNSKPEAGLPNFSRSKVYYNKNGFSKNINQLVNVVQKDFLEQNAYLDNEESIKARVKIAAYFFATVMPYVSSIKYPEFKGEHEHGINSLCLKENPSQKFTYPEENRASFDIKSKKRMYFSFELQYISEVWIGPRLDYDQAKKEIEKILLDLSLQGHNTKKIKIFRSSVPYKNKDKELITKD